MYRFRLGLLVLAASTAGCASGIKINMPEVHAKVNEGVTTQAQVKSTMHAVTPDGGPLAEFAVQKGNGSGKIALIDIDGVLLNDIPSGPYSAGENPVALFAEKLAKAAADPGVRAVVLRINSPGGSVAATDLMARELAAFRANTGKPVVAAILDVGAGGAYYLAAGCTQVTAIPTAMVGAIGVIFNDYYAEVAMEKLDLYMATVKEGDKTDMGSLVRKQTPEEKQLLQDMASEYRANFQRAVRAGRTAVGANSAVFDGRIMSAASAKSAGLVDTLGYLPEAYAEAGRLAGLAADAPVVMYARADKPPYTPYAAVANRSIHSGLIPFSLPGLDRARIPQFMYLWSPDPTLGHKGY